MSGKGSKPRPYSVDKNTFDKNWDMIFSKKKENNTGVDKNEYYDILTTEDALIDDRKEKPNNNKTK